jgi:hypothetical protein
LLPRRPCRFVHAQSEEKDPSLTTGEGEQKKEAGGKPEKIKNIQLF